jgi:hypothetical protein
MRYELVIDPNKWEPISNVELENETPYWCKMTNGRIVMASPYSNGSSSGMAKCFVDNNGIMIKSNEFYVLKGCMVQPVLEKRIR